MLEVILDEWTIVIAGNWNTGIFNPDWLRQNVFNTPELAIEVGMEPGTPRRIIGDKVLLIPDFDKLILNPKELDEAVLLRTEEVAIKLLDLLPHTPITQLGINFGYKATNCDTEIINQFPNFKATDFAEQDLCIGSRSYLWKLNQDGQEINCSCRIDDSNSLFFHFNFHSIISNISDAREKVEGNILPYRIKAESILSNIFGLTMEVESEQE